MRMHVYEAVEDDSPTVLLIHPMLSSASRMKAAVADHMGDGLHFLIPDLSSHGDEASAPYSSAIEEAEAIHSWLVDHGIRRLALGFGASLGGVVFFELLRFPDLSFDRLFIEGVSFYSGGPISRAGGAILSRIMVAKHRKAVRDPEAGGSQARAAFRRGGRPPHGRKPCRDERGEHSGDCARLLAGHTASPVPPTFSAAARSRTGRKTRTYGSRDARLRASIPARSWSCGRGGATASV